ncbi:MAG: oligosaccharide flippase family protein [Nitrospira sp.]|nr:oligosaccharide flippase family protein [Nitrospira sp.]
MPSFVELNKDCFMLTAPSGIKSGLQNIALIFASLVGSGFLAFLTQVILGHSLSMEDFGIVNTAVSIIVIMGAVIGFGIPSVWLLLYGREGEQAFRWVKQSVKFMLPWAAFVLAAFSIVLIGLIDDARLLTVIWWMQAMAVMQVMMGLLTAKLQLEARYGELSFWQLLPPLGQLAVASTAYLSATPNAFEVGKGYFLVSWLLIAASGISLLSMTPTRMRLAGHPSTSSTIIADLQQTPQIKDVLDIAWPYATSAALVMIYGRIEIVFLGVINSPIAAGTYAVAASFLLVASLPPQAIYQKFLLPKIHRWFYNDHQKFLTTFRLGCTAMTIAGIFGTMSIYFLGESLIVLFFGEQYRESGQILTMLAVCILIRYVSGSIESSLMTGNFTRHRVCCQVFITLVSVPSAFLLITFYGLDGAIVNKILKEFLLLVSFGYASSHFVFRGKLLSEWSLCLVQKK